MFGKLLIGLVAGTFAAAAPALAAGDCVYDGYNKGSPDVLKFVKWEFGKQEGRWLKINLTLHNNLTQTIGWFTLHMLVDGTSITLKKRQTLPAGSDAVITAEYEMSNADAAKFQSRAPLICVSKTEDEKGKSQNYD